MTNINKKRKFFEEIEIPQIVSKQKIIFQMKMHDSVKRMIVDLKLKYPNCEIVYEFVE